MSQLRGVKDMKQLSFFGIHCILLPSKTVFCELTVFFIARASPWSFDSVAHIMHWSSLLLELTRQWNSETWSGEYYSFLHPHSPPKKPIWDLSQALNGVVDTMLTGKQNKIKWNACCVCVERYFFFPTGIPKSVIEYLREIRKSYIYFEIAVPNEKWDIN